jgi:Ca2+-binding EF-hand superfamily protein
MVEKAFQMLDIDGKGGVSIKDIAGIYDVSMNPEFLEGRKTRDEILTDFLSNFEGAKGDGDGILTRAEFFDYYSDLSMSTPSDEYFVRMMESSWQVPEEENTAVTKQTVNHLLREVKARVFELARRDPAFLQKIFSDFDLNQSGFLTIDEVTNLIAKLKISVERKYVYPFFKVVDANNSGGIEYDEFEAYILSADM